MGVLAQAKNGEGLKMVRNGFVNRNVMQPMGRLSMHSKCLDLFSFEFWVAGLRGGFFSFFLCSQHVPFKFSMSSHQVLNMFLKDVPNTSLI
jgi:hypothetical protein